MGRRIFSYTSILITINVIAFVVYLFLAYFYGEGIVQFLALQPSSVLQGKYLWTFITSMFLHAGLGHLVANMISLAFIGGFIERLIGWKRYLYLYFVGGIIASLFFVIFAGFFGQSDLGAKLFGSPESFAVGASGAIFAVAGLLAVLIPRMKVLAFFIIPMPMWVAMIFFTVVMWFFSVSLSLPIGNTAHFGGLLVGVIYGIYLRMKYPKKTKMISSYFGG